MKQIFVTAGNEKAKTLYLKGTFLISTEKFRPMQLFLHSDIAQNSLQVILQHGKTLSI